MIFGVQGGHKQGEQVLLSGGWCCVTATMQLEGAITG